MTKSNLNIYVALVVVAAIGLLTFPLPFGRDQAGFAYLAQIALRHAPPYLANWDQKGPLIQFLYFPVAYGEPAFWKGHLLDLLAVIGVCLLLVRSMARTVRQDATVFVLIVFGAVYWSIGYWNLAQAESFMNVPIVGALILAMAPSARRYFFAGLLLGVAAMIKPITIIHLAALFVLSLRYSGRDKSEAALEVLAATVGFAIFPLFIVLAYAAVGGLTNFIECFVLFNYYASPTSVAGFDIAGNLGRAFILVIINFGIFSAFSIYGYRRLRGTVVNKQAQSSADELSAEDKIAKRAAAALAYFTLAGLLGVALQMKFWFYHWVIVFPMASIYAGIGLKDAWAAIRSNIRLSEKYLPLVGTTVFALFYIFLLYKSLAITPLLLADDKEHYYSYFSNDWEAFDALQSWQAAEYIRETTDPDDRVQFWGFEMTAGYLANRDSGTRFLFDLPLTYSMNDFMSAVQLKWKTQFIGEMNLNKPELLIMVSDDANSFEPVDSTTQAIGFGQLMAIVQNDYRQEKVIGRMTFYRRIAN